MRKNVRPGAKLCADIRSVDGSGEITTLVVNAIVAERPSCRGLPLTDFREKDADLSVILDQLADAVRTGEDVFVLFLAGPAAKAYWLNKEQFIQLTKYSTGIETIVTRSISSSPRDLVQRLYG